MIKSNFSLLRSDSKIKGYIRIRGKGIRKEKEDKIGKREKGKEYGGGEKEEIKKRNSTKAEDQRKIFARY